jgi:hypothetical protein
LKLKREKEEEERIKALPPREREDVKKRRERLSGGSLSSLPSLPPSLSSVNCWIVEKKGKTGRGEEKRR